MVYVNGTKNLLTVGWMKIINNLRGMRYCFDIDGTICSPTIGRDYHLAEPWYERIDVVNGLYDRGHYIIYFSARGMGRFGDDPDAPFKAEEILYDLTYDQLIE